MTATQQFIEDATKSGYSWEGTKGQAEILLDPLAWQAVGKTRGWDRQEEHTDGKILGDRFNGLRDKWKKNWHRFIDRLADGKTIEEALQAIS